MQALRERIDFGQAVVGVIGLGYVGLPISMLYAGKFMVVDYDIDTQVIHNLVRGLSTVNGVSSVPVVPNGIDPESYRCLPRRGEFRTRNELPDRPILPFLERLQKIKGLEYLARGYAALRRAGSDAILVIAGPDEGHKTKLLRIVRNLGLERQVFFTGFERNVTQAYVDADLLAYPAPYEIFGLVPLEASMCGTPVVVTRGSGASDIVTSANAGDVVDFGDVGGLRSAMRSIVSDPRNAARRTIRGKQYLIKHASWPMFTTNVEKLYEDCVRHI